MSCFCHAAPHTHVSRVPRDIHRCHGEPPILLSNNTSGVTGLTRDDENMMWRIHVKLPCPDEDLVIARVFKDAAFGSRIAYFQRKWSSVPDTVSG